MKIEKNIVVEEYDLKDILCAIQDVYFIDCKNQEEVDHYTASVDFIVDNINDLIQDSFEMGKNEN